MKFSGHNITNSDRWQNYQQLELIPDTVSKPDSNRLRFWFGLDLAWQILLSLLADELVEEQQMEYLERCWNLDEFGHKQDNSSFLQRLWKLMN
jgi:hypothetical protein